MPALPIREMVLYKHGVGFFTRNGLVSGDDAVLTFKPEDINDVLKSLAVFDRNGGQILGIDYLTQPPDALPQIAEKSQRELLRSLVGRTVFVAVSGKGSEIETVTGRLVGIDDMHSNTNQVFSVEGLRIISIFALMMEENTVRFFQLEDLRGLQILDEQAAQDLNFTLDRASSTRREIHIRMNKGEHDLVAHYVAPAPTWRVSYRVIAEEENTALLQGWGLFDNHLEEDLENIRLTLVAGQPISFIYDLQNSQIPHRPTVQDEARVAAGPVEFQAAAGRVYRDEDDIDIPTSLARKRNVPKPVAPLAAAPAAPPATLEVSDWLMEEVGASYGEAARSTVSAAEGKAAGEFFQYQVTHPITVKRGASALVPILNTEIKYERELLYNGAKLPKHPVAALRFTNTSGLTLERGPVTLVEEGDYKGEAIIPFTKENSEVYLAYAVELGVEVTEQPSNHHETHGIHIHEALLVYEQHHIQRVMYQLQNTTDKPMTVTIEAAINHLYSPFDTPEPIAETATHRRWRIEIQPHARNVFIRKERRKVEQRSALASIAYADLQRYFQNGWIDRTTLDRIAGILEQYTRIRRLEEEIKAMAGERQTLYQQQEQLRQNLKTLQSGGEEGTLRSRMLKGLETSQDRLDALDEQESRLGGEIEAARVQIQSLIAALNAKQE